MDSLAELAIRAKARDADAFTKIYEQLYKDLYRLALYTLKNTHDAEDLVSETVTDAWQQIASLRDETACRAWIFKILTNKCRKKLKQYLSRTVELPDTLVSAGRDICEEMDVRRAFAALTPEERLILSMNLFGGYSSREIGRQLKLSDNTVRSKQSRALKKMQQSLADQEERRTVRNG